MTAFNKTTDLPSGIDTLEKLMVWNGAALLFINQTKMLLEGDNPANASNIRVIQSSPFVNGALASDIHSRWAGRFSIRLNDGWVQGSSKLWLNAQELATTALPTEFKT